MNKTLKQIPQKDLDMMVCKSIEELAEATSQTLDVFLREYCEVNKIVEGDLRNHLELLHSPMHGTVSVRRGDLDIFRETVCVSLEKGKCVIHFYLMDKSSYPKTLNFIREMNEGKRKTA